MKILIVSMDNAEYGRMIIDGKEVTSRSVEVALSECIANKGHDITLVVDKEPYYPNSSDKPSNLKIIITDVNGIPTEEQMNSISEGDYEICFATSISGAKIVNQVAKAKNIPSVTQVLDVPEFRLNKEFWEGKIRDNKWAVQWDDYFENLKGSNFIIINTEPGKRSLLARNFDESKIRKVYYGIDCKLCDSIPEPKELAYHISFVSRHVWYKGTQILLYALALLKKEGFEPRTAIIGTGSDTLDLMQLKELFGLNNVYFLGGLTNEQKFNVIKHSVIGVIPEFNGDIGSLAPYEYIYTKKPVVCFDVPIHRERALNYPYYVSPFDIYGLKEMIKTLLSGQRKPDEKILEEGKNFILEERSFDSNARELIICFEEFIKIKKEEENNNGKQI